MTPIFGRDQEVKAWVEAAIGLGELQSPFVAIGIEDKGGIVAGVVYNNYRNGCDIEVHLAGKAGKLWATRENLGVWFGYPFNQLGVKRITSAAAGKNIKSRRFTEHVGFTQEGIMRGSLPNDDLIIYGMLKNECRWIGGINGQNQSVTTSSTRPGSNRQRTRSDEQGNGDCQCSVESSKLIIYLLQSELHRYANR